MLRLPDAWIWDSWVVDDGERFHMFFLQAPRALVFPRRRHEAATIGHATSRDLTDWTYPSDAPLPSTDGWDDLGLWTGSVARGDDGVWRRYYTALSTAGNGVFDQRIGLAESDDLRTWRRVGTSPVLQADPRWHKTLDGHGPASETRRDPFVLADPDGDGWHMLVAVRDKDAPRLSDGVLAHARSHHMRSWELGPPLAAPANFGQVEMPQICVIDGHPLFSFICHPLEQSEHQQAGGRYCTWTALVARSGGTIGG
jgi:beta-fructofuranosidase